MGVVCLQSWGGGVFWGCSRIGMAVCVYALKDILILYKNQIYHITFSEVRNMGLFGTAIDSLKWGFSINFKKILRWLLLTVILIIPIVDFIGLGALLKIFKGEEPELSPVGKNFINGLLYFIIQLIYMAIPLIIFFILGGVSMLPMASGNDAGVAVGAGIATAGVIIALIVTVLLFGLILVPATINFARTGKFGKAFAFGEIFGLIGKLGWGKYILAIIVCIIVSFVVGLVLGIIGLIPVLGWIVLILATVPLYCFGYKYWNEVFA